MLLRLWQRLLQVIYCKTVPTGVVFLSRCTSFSKRFVGTKEKRRRDGAGVPMQHFLFGTDLSPEKDELVFLTNKIKLSTDRIKFKLIKWLWYVNWCNKTKKDED
jgi:hypothetical protein